MIRWALALTALVALTQPSAAFAQRGVDELIGEIEGLLGLGGGAAVDADALVAAELPGVEAATSLTSTRPVQAELITREEAVAHIAGLIEVQLPAERAAAMEIGWKALGLLSADQSLREEVLGLYGSQVGGFYDPARGTLFLLSDMHPMLQLPVVRHELVHALQDQRWPLQRWLGDAGLDEDRAAAMQAVLEGHASAAMNRATLRSVGIDAAQLQATTDPALLDELAELFGVASGADLGDLNEVSQLGVDDALLAAFLPRDTPPALRAQLLFPYSVGTRFVAGYRSRHPEDPTCAALFARPPRTSAEVLRPDLWESGTFAPAFASPGKFLPGWKQTWSSTLGRLLSHVVLTNQADPFAGSPQGATWDPANRDSDVAITANWAGDHVAVYQSPSTPSGTSVPGQHIVVWVSKWEGPAAARRVAGEAQRRLPHAVIEVAGDIVRVVVAPDEALAGSALRALIGWK